MSSQKSTHGLANLTISPGMPVITRSKASASRRPGPSTKHHQVDDLLSTFDPDDLLPHEYAAVNVEDADVKSNEKRYRRFGTAIITVCDKHADVLQHIRKAISIEESAAISVGKLERRLVDTIKAHETYLEEGLSKGAQKMDVVDCGEKLRAITHAVDRLRTTWPHRPALTDLEGITPRLAKLLLQVLDYVAGRDSDAYASVSRPRPSYVDLARHRNLFLYLIGEPQSVEESEFLLDELKNLGDAVWEYDDDDDGALHMLARKISSKLRDAPRAYRKRFADVAGIDIMD